MNRLRDAHEYNPPTEEVMRALCASDPELWFSDAPADQAVAIATCMRCPVRDWCRDWMDGQEHQSSLADIQGIVAGETPAQRMRRRGHRRYARPGFAPVGGVD